MVGLSSLDIHHLAHELGVVADAFVDQVYQTRPDEFLLRLRHRTHGKQFLALRPGQWAALVEQPPQTPPAPPPFAAALRKRLNGARVRQVRQHGFDRVLVLDLERGGEPFTLVLELFGKGNLIVVAKDGVTDLAWRTQSFRDREVRPGEPFGFPTARDHPRDTDASSLYELASTSQRDLVRFLAVDAGWGGDLAEGTLFACGIDKRAKAKETTLEDYGRLIEALRGFLDQQPEPSTVQGKKGPNPQSVPLGGTEGTPYKTMSQAILAAAASESDDQTTTVEDPELDRLRRQIVHQEDGIAEMQEKAAAIESAAQSMYSDVPGLQARLDTLTELVAEASWAGLAGRAKADDALDWILQVDPRRRTVRIRHGGHEFPVDPSASVEANASQHFDRAKALRRKSDGAAKALEETRAKAAARAKRRDRAQSETDRQATLATRRHWFEAYRWCYTTDGFLVLAGRDAATNDKLVKKHLKPGDVYCHADVSGAPSVVLKTEGQEPSDQALDEACRFAATFSKAFNQFASTDAYWVRPEQVSKTPQSGEFVPRGAWIVRGKRNYRKDLPLEAGIGLVRLDKQGRPAPSGDKDVQVHLMGGPWISVQAHAEPALRLVRGQAKASTAAKEIAKQLHVPTDDVAGRLPPGTMDLEAFT